MEISHPDSGANQFLHLLSVTNGPLALTRTRDMSPTGELPDLECGTKSGAMMAEVEEPNGAKHFTVSTFWRAWPISLSFLARMPHFKSRSL